MSEPSGADPECEAIRRIVEALASLSIRARGRVLRYVLDAEQERLETAEAEEARLARLVRP